MRAYDVVVAEARGLPMRSLWCEPGMSFTDVAYPPIGGIQISEDYAHVTDPEIEPTLPLRPIIPGFLINTILYAFVCFAVFTSPGALKRALRTRRGHCAQCGYDLRGADAAHPVGCPECGWGRE